LFFQNGPGCKGLPVFANALMCWFRSAVSMVLTPVLALL
jgi:hypothetical protein